jgi:hypothetical protein
MALIDDSSPELGGNLNLNGYAFTDYVNGAIRFGSTPFEDTSIITTATSSILFAGTTTGNIFEGNPDISVVRHCVSKGTLTHPENTTPGDVLGAWSVNGYHNGEWKTASTIMTRWAPNADMSTVSPASQIAFVTGGNGGMYQKHMAMFDEKGVFTAPIFSATTYTTEALPASPMTGWVVFDKTTNQFKGWNGSDWTVLG